MENLYIEGEHGEFFIPHIDFNAGEQTLLIQGESYLEDTVAFYIPVLDWIKQLGEEKSGPIRVDIKLTYYNTSSSKSLLDILMAIKNYEALGNPVTINWYYMEDDWGIEEEVEDFEIDTELKINMVPFPPGEEKKL